MNTSKHNFDEPARVIKREDAPERTVYALTFKEAFINYFTSRFSKENFRRFVKDSFPNKEDSTKEKIRKTVMDVSFVLLMLGLSYIVFYYFSYRERISDLGKWEVTIDSIDQDELFDFEIKQLWKNIREKYPDVDFPEGMNLKFADLYAVNQDTVGALRIAEKNLFFPLMQNKSTPTYYLWRDLYGQYSRYGNPYVDYRCDMGSGGLSKNTIIYGHNTHDKLGFNKLTDYMKLDGYKKAPVISLETLYEKTQWKIFAVMLTNSTAAADRGHLFRYLITDFSSDKDFMTMLDGIKQRSMINTGIDVNEDDKILTLYTCYQDIFEGGRLVVFARLLRDGESAHVDVSKASFNHKARYPQAYYDQLGLKNPYEDLTKPIYFIEDEHGSVIAVETTDTEETTESEETTGKSQNKPSSSDKATTSVSGSSSGDAQQKPSGDASSETTKAPEQENTTSPAEEPSVTLNPETESAASAEVPAGGQPESAAA